MIYNITGRLDAKEISFALLASGYIISWQSLEFFTKYYTVSNNA
jgi:hypothetical protein